MSGTGSQEFQTPLGGAPATGQITVDQQRNQMLASAAKSLATLVTSFAPVTANQSANTVFSGPTSGSAAAPAFRSLVSADIPLVFTSSNIASPGSGITSGSAQDITSLPLAIGTYIVFGNIGFLAAASTVPTQLEGWTSVASATLPTFPNAGALFDIQVTYATATLNVIPVGMQVLTMASSGTVYLSARAAFTVSTMTVYGYLGALRIH